MKERGHSKTQVGIVVSVKMDKTVVVRVDKLLKHPVYKKYVRGRAAYKVHDEKNESRVGDKVEIMESRPLSKEKRWRIYRTLEKAL